MIVKVSPKYQVVIPLLVRRALGLEAGTKVDVVVKGKIAYIVPILSLSTIQRKLSDRLTLKDIRDKKDRL